MSRILSNLKQLEYKSIPPPGPSAPQPLAQNMVCFGLLFFEATDVEDPILNTPILVIKLSVPTCIENSYQCTNE